MEPMVDGSDGNGTGGDDPVQYEDPPLPEVGDAGVPPQKRKRSKAGVSEFRSRICHPFADTLEQDYPMEAWLTYLPRVLDILMVHDAFPSNCKNCPDCLDAPEPKMTPAEFRCRECGGFEAVCKDCLLARHRRLPLHRIEV